MQYSNIETETLIQLITTVLESMDSRHVRDLLVVLSILVFAGWSIKQILTFASQPATAAHFLYQSGSSSIPVLLLLTTLSLAAVRYFSHLPFKTQKETSDMLYELVQRSQNGDLLAKEFLINRLPNRFHQQL